MTYGPVTRPKAADKKIRTSEDFELCYLRHQYFRRVKYNPTQEEMAPYMKIVENLTKNTFFTYYNLFKTVGMYHDDVTNIGRVHLISFLGLYSLEKNKKKGKEFAERFVFEKKKDPTAADFEQKNKANFTCFFKQRMEDLVRVCKQKAKNIKGQTSEDFVVFCGKIKPPKYPRKLLRDHAEWGYKKLDLSVFKSIRKKADVSNDATMFSFGGNWYVAIAVEQKPLELEDLVTSDINPYTNIHNMTPETLFENSPIKGSSWNEVNEGDVSVKTDRDSDYYKRLFNNRSNYRKRVKLQNFIAKNRNNVQYNEEIKAAKKLLKSLGGWIR